MISLSVDRSGLTLAALAFDTPGVRWVPEDGITYPEKRWRREYVDSRNLHGSVLVRATLEHAAITGTLYVQAATTADLDAAKAEVEQAFGQFFYSVTVTEDGVAHTYDADPADVSWGTFDSGKTKAHIATATVNIPVYPIASA